MFELSTKRRRLLNFPVEYLLLSISSLIFCMTLSLLLVWFLVMLSNSMRSFSISARSYKWSKSVILLNLSLSFLFDSNKRSIVNRPFFCCYFLIILTVWDQKCGIGFSSWLAKILSIFTLICANLFSSSTSIFAFLTFDSAIRSATFA